MKSGSSRNNLFSEFSKDEEARIKTAYARRKAAVDENLYTHFNRGNLFILQQRERWVLALLEESGYRPLNTKRILEIGCGNGYWLREFIKWGARPENIAGIDLLPERIAEGRQLCPEAVGFQCGNAEKLEFPDASFDIVLQSTVFTSILDSEMKRRIAAEMLRVLKPDGIILWYDYHVNNPSNPDVRAVEKREIEQLFPGCRIELKRMTLAPPLARLLAPYSWLLCYLLEGIPFLRTHYVGVIQKG